MPTLLLLTPSLFFVHRKSPIFLSHCPAPLGDLPSGPSLSPWITSCRYPLHARGFKTEEEAREETVVAQQTKKNRTPRKKNMPPLYLLQNAGASLWAPKGAVGVVTGANKGIGLEIAAGLAANGLPVIATARSEERGRAAVEAIKSRAETEAEVSFLQLDVASDASVSEFARKLRGAAPAGVAVLVNNAAIAFKGQTWGGDEAEETVNTNYRGTRRVTEAVLPLLVEGGRVVNVCSRSGQLQRLFGGGGGNGGGGSGSGGGSPRSPRPPPISDEKEVLKKKWVQAAETGDFAAIDNLASEFVAAVREGTAGVAGWPRSMYGVSVRKECREFFFVLEREKRLLTDLNLTSLPPPAPPPHTSSQLKPLCLPLSHLRSSPRSATRAPSPCPSPRKTTRNTEAKTTSAPLPSAPGPSRRT